MSTNIIKCDTIDYRSGYIEISRDIHPGCINIEAWKIHPELNIKELSIRDYEFPDELTDSEGKTVDSVSGSVELELNIEQAKNLVQQLQDAIEAEESKAKQKID